MFQIQKTRNFMEARIVRLAASYLLIIMTMSVIYSITFYNVSTSQLINHLMTTNSLFEQTTISSMMTGSSSGPLYSALTSRIEKSENELLLLMIFINIVTLFIGMAISYYLAKRTLAPIEKVIEKQNRFVSDVSHELRTPITALHITNEVGLRKNKLTITEAKDIIQHNIEESDRLKNLTDNLLNLLKQDKKIYSLEAVDVSEAAKQAVNSLEKHAEEKGIKIVNSIADVLVLADGPGLVQVLTILIENAIKYSPKSSEINLVASTKSGQVKVKISDKGIGIAKADIDHIFDRFYRVDGSRSSNGFGLGLSIAKESIENMGGEISVKSTLSKGSTFCINLPAIKA